MKRILIRVILLSALIFWLYGCGDDISGGLYATSVSFSDASDDGTLAFDIHQRICKAATVSAPAEYEDFTDVFAVITLDVADGMPGVTINSYSIEYEPLVGSDRLGNLVTPPSLEVIDSQSEQGSYNFHVGSNTIDSFTITCFSITQKVTLDYLTSIDIYDAAGNLTADGDLDGLPDGDGVIDAPFTYIENYRYTINITLHCTDDNGYNRDIEIKRTVYLGRYDNC